MTGAVCRGPLGLAGEGEAVLIVAADVVGAGDVLGGLAHREGVVHRGEARVDEAPADGGVGELLLAVEGGLCFAEDQRGAAHGLDAAGDEDVAVV